MLTDDSVNEVDIITVRQKKLEVRCTLYEGHTLPSCSLIDAITSIICETSSWGVSLVNSWAVRLAALEAASMAGTLCLISYGLGRTHRTVTHCKGKHAEPV